MSTFTVGPSVHRVAEAARPTAGFFNILAGSPGTGKTFVAATIIRAIKAGEGSARIETRKGDHK